jgi:phage gpG-like protein
MPLSLGFQLDVAGAVRSLRAIRSGLSPESAPLRQAVSAAGAAYLDASRERFIRNSGGGEWAPLSPSTLRTKNPNPGILRRNDHLLNSLTPGAAGNVFLTIPGGVRVGTSVPYAGFHQHGTSRMPARTILVAPSPEAVERMRKPIETTVRQVVKASAAAAA